MSTSGLKWGNPPIPRRVSGGAGGVSNPRPLDCDSRANGALAMPWLLEQLAHIRALSARSAARWSSAVSRPAHFAKLHWPDIEPHTACCPATRSGRFEIVTASRRPRWPSCSASGGTPCPAGSPAGTYSQRRWTYCSGSSVTCPARWTTSDAPPPERAVGGHHHRRPLPLVPVRRRVRDRLLRRLSPLGHEGAVVPVLDPELAPHLAVAAHPGAPAPRHLVVLPEPRQVVPQSVVDSQRVQVSPSARSNSSSTRLRRYPELTHLCL